VKDVNVNKWRKVRQIHPNAQKGEFEIWSRWIWEQYLRYKMKPLAKKKKERNSNEQNSTVLTTDEPPVQPTPNALQTTSRFSPTTVPVPFGFPGLTPRLSPRPRTPPLTSRTLSTQSIGVQDTPVRQLRRFSINTPKSGECQSTESTPSKVARAQTQDSPDLPALKRPRFFLSLIDESMRSGYVDPADVIAMALRVQEEIDSSRGDNFDVSRSTPTQSQAFDSIRRRMVETSADLPTDSEMGIDSPTPIMGGRIISENNTRQQDNSGTTITMEDVLQTESSEEIPNLHSKITPNPEPSPPLTMDGHIISENNIRRPEDSGMTIAMEDVLHMESSEEIPNLHSKITPNPEQSPPPTMDGHISENNPRRPDDSGTAIAMEEVLHMESSEKITDDGRSKITPNPELSPPKHNGASDRASNTPRSNRRRRKDDSNVDPDYQPSDLSASSSDEYNPSEDSQIIGDSYEYGIGVSSHGSEDEFNDSIRAQSPRAHIDSTSVPLSSRSKKTPIVFWDDKINLDDFVLEEKEQKERNIGNIDIDRIAPNGLPGSEDVIILSGENDAVPSSPVALTSKLRDLLSFDLCEFPADLREKLRAILYFLPQVSLISRKEGLKEGIEKEHKWLRDFDLEETVRPGVRSEIGLFPWQVLGVQFLHFCRQHYGFGLLADEMGVGKVASFSY